MEINRSNILEIVNGLNIKAIKQYGQNFLSDPKYSSLIVESLNPSKEDIVLEIGPGLGSLTHFLIQKSDDVTAVDIDDRMIKFLSVQYEGSKNLRLVGADILRYDVSNYDMILGNLPYYITTDIIIYILLKAEKAKRLVFMVQKEAYPRFSSKVNEDGYGPISILISMLGNIKKITNVGAGAFYPNPHVDSLVFQIDIDLSKRTNETFVLYKFIKSLFLNKRKTILNNLSGYLKDKEKAEQILNKCEVPNNKRPEELSLEHFKNIFSNI